MPVKKIITSTIPNVLTKHYWQTENVKQVGTTLTDLSRQAFAAGKILSVLKYKEPLVVRSEVVWISREECDAADQQLFTLHPEYEADRDAYNTANGITWTITYENI